MSGDLPRPSTPLRSEETVIVRKEHSFPGRARSALRGQRDTEPLRAELFSIEQLKRHAEALAARHRIHSRPGPDKLLPRLAENERVLRAAYEVVTAAEARGQRIVPAEAWLLDNYYLIEQQIGLARRHLPRGYSRELPRLVDGPSAGFPRIHDLALELISHMDGRVDRVNATQSIAAYQTVSPLKLGELWAFPIMLQLALLENLRRVALRIARRRQERDSAILWAEKMLATAEREPKRLIKLLAEFADADVPLTAPFVEEFYSRLDAQETTLSFVRTWVEQKLHDQGISAAQLSEAAAQTAAANQISIANSIGSLRSIGALDWKTLVESLSAVEQTLRADPAGKHDTQDFITRDRYRHAVEDVAHRSKHSETDVAHEAIGLAQAAADAFGTEDRRAHVGYYLIDRGRALLEDAVGYRLPLLSHIRRTGRQFRLFFYLVPVVLLATLATSGALLTTVGLEPADWRFWFIAVTGMIGSSALAIPLVNLLVTLVLPPRTLPRLDFSQGVPDAHRTMVIVPTLLGKTEDIDSLIDALEIRYLGNRDPNIFFALLTDFPDAPACTMPGDDELLAGTRDAIRDLNETYSDDRLNIFFLLHRPRVWNACERVWMGHERKRGKLEQFNALLRGENEGAFSEIYGDRAILPSIRHVITLDTDTQLPRDTARKLIGSMAHPLNRPVYDAGRGRVVEGYAILQPRASISLLSARQSHFTRLFAGDSGIDPYTRETSDVYQDLFGEGSYIGKGIYDVDAFRQAVSGRFPDNLILSHDLLESGYARSALITDVELIEEHPASYAIEASRRHRWIRGDWQLAGWLLPRVPGPIALGEQKEKRQRNPLTPLSIWKLFDNLRRSLVAPSLLFLLTGGWLMGLGPVWFWILLVSSVMLLPPMLGTVIDAFRKPEAYTWWSHLMLTAKATRRPLTLALLTLVFLPYDALIAVDALLRSGVKMLFTRRGLLIWQLRSYAARNARRTLLDFYREMWVAPVLALILGAIFILTWTGGMLAGWLVCAPVLLLWLASPFFGWWISRPLSSPTPPLNTEQRLFLRAAAARTWRYFAEFVSAEDNWLPPDNFQEYPAPAIASRTSPTNMGMALLANLAAYDFGYISAGQFLERCGQTITSMEKLERHRGHFYNWYDTRSLQPLHPRYVSSVDSGNLAGSLLTLQTGLAEMKSLPILPAGAFEGLQDTLKLVADHQSSPPDRDFAKRISLVQTMLDARGSDRPARTPAMDQLLLTDIQRVSRSMCETLQANDGADEELRYWTQTLDRQCTAFHDDLELLTPDPASDGAMSTLEQLGGEHTVAVERLAYIDELVERCRALADMDFDFLYDASSDLLVIGYDVGERRRDPSCYDLLASEARLTSFILIAKGQLPQKHWFSLGRLLTTQGGDVSLISWSGSMFEYLMPRLMMPDYENTLLEQTCNAAVSRQIEYGRQRAVPWGISESCYNATDAQHVYQYRAFGVPGLGFKRGLGDDLVIAPYASALALTVAPREACDNLQVLAAKGMLGIHGFYEAVDYTPSRLPPGKNHAVVRTYMAHHQGMSLLSFAHVLLGHPMQRRFMSVPFVRATELLLQERVPKRGAALHPHASEVHASARPPVADEDSVMRVFTDVNTTVPEVHLLSNGRYHVMATNAGGSYSRWHDLAVTRWREDAVSDGWGTFVYLRDPDMGRYWSAAYQPTLRKADHYESIFVQARVEYRRRDHAIETHTELSVSPEDDVEIRRVTLTNLSFHTRRIEVTSYAEVVLAQHNADLAHRTFSNLFVQTEILPDHQAILCTRRRRTPDDEVPWMFHLLAAPAAQTDDATYETDRVKFIGRGRSAVNPIALESGKEDAGLSNTDGAVLDPIVAIRRTITLSADESATVQIVTGVADTREEALALIEKYCDRHFVDRAFEMAWFQSQEVLRHIGADETDAQLYGRLANSVIFRNAMRRAAPGIIIRNRLGQSGLWRFAVSGDLPIVLLRIGDLAHIDLVKQVLQAHAYWRLKGLATDLVIINEDFSGYRALLHDQIMGLINAGTEAQVIDRPGGVFVRRTEELSEEDRVLFLTVAHIVLSDRGGTLSEQMERRVTSERLPPRLDPPVPPAAETIHPLAQRDRIFCNGLGGFTADGHEYVITQEPGQNTPAPWVNVIASPHIGTVVSESGGAYTWVGNAHEFRLTTWHNDALSDSSGEALYIRDEETGAYWSPTPLPARGTSGYVCRHGFGYSIYEHFQAGISSEMSTYVAMDAPVKFVVVKLHNHSGRPRMLSLTSYWELVLGEWRHANLMHIVTETERQTGAVFARNAYGRECAGRLVFAQVSERERTVTGSRAEFIGRNGTLAKPSAMRRARLSSRTGAGLDPCAAMQTQITLADGDEREIVFIFGTARDSDEALYFIHRFGHADGARQALEAVWGHWNHTLGAVRVETPDAALDVLANGWLIYQTISSRFWGRSGYYQSGGAYGFRDQLQDSLAMLHATPWLTREQIIRCSGRQFLQGDVQHWWHPPNGQGVRTHFSDDYLWLPHTVCRYVEATGDTGVLDENVHFLEGRQLNPEEESYYDQPQRSAEAASVYEHCVRALKYGLRYGTHQLPLMGSGDWNDGMNLVGHEGKGESVWLAWFLYENLQRFAALARGRGDDTVASFCEEHAMKLRGNIELHAWDGSWYRRAYFDDGTPLGSQENEECRIDSISQSWAVISGAGDPERSRRAMAAVDAQLVQRDAQLIKLLAPPFDTSDLEPGYIKGYVPGVRENGGQYTHAAIWTTMAFALQGENERAWELYAMLNPVHHGSRPEQIERYKVEPYVMSADIYAVPPHTGRGGWTWYTGSAGWMYRLTVETLLGLQREAGQLRFTPRIPAHWDSYSIRYRYRESMYHITITRLAGASGLVTRVILNGGTIYNADAGDPESSRGLIPLADDHAEHHVSIELG